MDVTRAALLSLGLLASAASAGSGGVLATGFGSSADGAYADGGSGVQIEGSAWAVYRFRALRSSTDTVVQHNPLWTGFTLAVRDDAPRMRVGFETSVRGGVDLGTGQYRGEVLYAHVDLAPEGRWLRARLGRQLVVANGRSGLTRIDGASVRFSLHYLQIEGFAGVDLRTNSVVLPEADKEPTGWGRDWAYGFSVGTTGLKDTQLRVGFQDRLRDGVLARRHLTVDLHKGVLGRVNVRGNLSIDLLQRRLQEVFAAVEGRPLTWLKVGGEYERWQPSFDATAIWSVFDVDPFDQIRGSAQVNPTRWLDAWFSGGVQLLRDSESKDGVPFPETGDAFGSQQAGVGLRPLPWLQVRVDERFGGGAGGEKFALATTVSARPLGGRIEAQLRGDVQRYAYEQQPLLEGWYGGVLAEVAGRPLPWLKAGVRGESLFSPLLTNQWQLMATLQFDLALRGLGPAVAPAEAVAALTPGLTGGIGLGGGR